MLYIVPTPIGNLEDITLRAIRVLGEVDLILCEDTRTSKVLLNHYEISTPLRSYHIYNEHEILSEIIDKLRAGLRIALISDAGTPAISDPGFLLVREAIKNDIEIISLPGPTAFVPGLINSGLAMDRFCFEGFLPHKKGRLTRLQKLVEEERTIILYESPHRLIKTLSQLAEHLGEEREASVSKEITKIFEENIRGSLRKLIQHFESKPIKGEIVICVEGRK